MAGVFLIMYVQRGLQQEEQQLQLQGSTVDAKQQLQGFAELKQACSGQLWSLCSMLATALD